MNEMELIVKTLVIVKCDCCGEEADYSDYGISLCQSCKDNDNEGLGHLYDSFIRWDMTDTEDF